MDEYIKFLWSYCDLYGELASMQQQKLDIILANSVIELDDFVKHEQVYVLKTRSMEEKRLEMQKQLGLGECRFKEMIEQVEDGLQRQQLLDIRTRLANFVEIIQKNNQLCQGLVEERLTSLEKKVKTLNNDQKLKIKPSHLINRSI